MATGMERSVAAVHGGAPDCCHSILRRLPFYFARYSTGARRPAALGEKGESELESRRVHG